MEKEIKIKCQVNNCNRKAEYVNELSSLKYCHYHALAKNFKIWLDKEHTRHAKLILIKTKPFNMGDL